MRIDHDLHRSSDGTLHVGRAWRWYPTKAGGGKLRYVGSLREASMGRKLDRGLHQSADGTIHVDPSWHWYPTQAGGGKLVQRPMIG